MQTIGRRLLWHGMVLFLLGLLTGLAEQNFSNTWVGLAAHLEGVMNGIFLFGWGAVGRKFDYSPRLSAARLQR